MTRLDVLADFKAFPEHPLDLVNSPPQLKDKAVRCLSAIAIRASVQQRALPGFQRHRSIVCCRSPLPSHRIVLALSIRDKGHGTSPQIFRDGIQLSENLRLTISNQSLKMVMQKNNRELAVGSYRQKSEARSYRQQKIKRINDVESGRLPTSDFCLLTSF